MRPGSSSSGLSVKQINAAIGAAARRGRKVLELTQEDVAELIGISGEFYARIERGQAMPSITTFAKMVNVLQMSADELLGLTEPAAEGAGARLRRRRPAVARTVEIERPEVRRIVRRLRTAPSSRVRVVQMVVKELEREFGDDDGEDTGDRRLK